MSIFNQLVPRLSRSLGRNQGTPESQPEFTLKPAYQLTETPEAWGLTTHLPGVTKQDLEVTAEEGYITIRGRRAWQQPEILNFLGMSASILSTVDDKSALRY